jgi:hypothetical protein
MEEADKVKVADPKPEKRDPSTDLKVAVEEANEAEKEVDQEAVPKDATIDKEEIKSDEFKSTETQGLAESQDPAEAKKIEAARKAEEAKLKKEKLAI